MLELMEPECESKLVALALQHLAQGWVATEENCDLDEKRASKFTPSKCLQTKKLIVILSELSHFHNLLSGATFAANKIPPCQSSALGSLQTPGKKRLEKLI